MSDTVTELRAIKRILIAILACLIILILYVARVEIMGALALAAVVFIIYGVVSNIYRWSQL